MSGFTAITCSSYGTAVTHRSRRRTRCRSSPGVRTTGAKRLPKTLLTSGATSKSGASTPFLRASHQRSVAISASSFSSQNRMSISWNMSVAVVRCSWACRRSPVRR